MEHKVIYRYGYRWVVYDPKEKKSDLSYESGVYLIRIKKSEETKWTIIYAGETRCFRSRITSHLVINTVLRQIKKYETTDSIHILFHCCGWDRKRIEVKFINKYSPMYNYIIKIRRSDKDKNRWGYFLKQVS